MDLILLFFKSSKFALQELYKCNDIETMFDKRFNVVNTHQLIEMCNEEMDNYMSTLEKIKSEYSSTSKHEETTRATETKKHVPWTTKSSSNRLVKVADQIGRAIPEMRELYILSENILKRVDLAGEWFELYTVIIGDLEQEAQGQFEDMKVLKKQMSSSGLSGKNFGEMLSRAYTNSNITNLNQIKHSARNNVTELEFLQQSLNSATSYGSPIIPYFNGAQKIVVTK